MGRQLKKAMIELRKGKKMRSHKVESISTSTVKANEVAGTMCPSQSRSGDRDDSG